MKIDERIGAEAAARQSAAMTETQRSRQASSAEGAEASGGASPDSARISGLAGRIRGRLEAMAGDHAARVEGLAAEVQSGRYRVDVEALSRALTTEALGGAGL